MHKSAADKTSVCVCVIIKLMELLCGQIHPWCGFAAICVCPSSLTIWLTHVVDTMTTV